MRIRAAALLAVPALPLAAVLLSAGPAAAHGDTIDFTITAQADGHTREVAKWGDGDPVDEPVAATLSATATDGRTIGPWKLVAIPGAAATYTTAQTLPPGTWKVVVEAGFPDLGRGEADITINAVPGERPSAGASTGPTASTGPSTGTATPTVTAPVAAAPAAKAHSSHTLYWIAAAVAVVAGAVVTLGLRRRRAQG